MPAGCEYLPQYARYLSCQAASPAAQRINCGVVGDELLDAMGSKLTLLPEGQQYYENILGVDDDSCPEDQRRATKTELPELLLTI